MQLLCVGVCSPQMSLPIRVRAQWDDLWAVSLALISDVSLNCSLADRKVQSIIQQQQQQDSADTCDRPNPIPTASAAHCTSESGSDEICVYVCEVYSHW